MPVNSAQLAAGAMRQLQTYAKTDPIDQFTVAHPYTDWLIKKSVFGSFGNGIYNDKVRITNDSNYQNYDGDDQVDYNRRDTVRLAAYQHYNFHDGFGLNETELANNGIIYVDSNEPQQMTDAEAIQIVNLLKENRTVLKNGAQTAFDLEMHRDGSASAKACPGLDLFVSTTPSSTTLGGIDASTTPNAYWRNNINLNIASTTGLLVAAMETEYRKCMTYGGMAPDAIFCGSKFLDAYVKDVRDSNSFQVSVPSKGGVTIDGGRAGVYFRGIEVVWDPSMDVLQAADDPTIDWDKRCYFLQSKSFGLRKVPGRWMQERRPSRMYDRYIHYWALTADYGLRCNQRNTMSVLSIA